MTAQQALKDALRERLGPSARERGYQGSAPTWRKSNAAGDWAVVNIQSSSSSTSERLRCILNLAVAPQPWLRLHGERLGRVMPKKVSESLGLYRRRLHPAATPAGIEGWWEISDAGSAAAAVQDMVEQLELDGFPTLERMLAPKGMLQQVRSGDLGYIKRVHHEAFFAYAEAALSD
ncbi:DUF4304 domain-containing protein [Luteipulveratus flavus]|uniref:DUF4304 domain-containing protein n=1 Tax=Luteipulveratus flavus TaxID=3031728 RepID=A0ABT6CAN4_9MICO|nr:DUF4304 domain-containing protein [Luteipulveratus sp. YIM 133296]MDF8265588.1 DUF4304 domain-containing protein [Luteipulveratus sp. YIM 133296]